MGPRPAGEVFRRPVQQHNVPCDVRGDHTIANGTERDSQSLLLGRQGVFDLLALVDLRAQFGVGSPEQLLGLAQLTGQPFRCRARPHLCPGNAKQQQGNGHPAEQGDPRQMLFGVQFKGRQRGEINRPTPTKSFQRHCLRQVARNGRISRRQDSVTVKYEVLRRGRSSVEDFDVHQAIRLRSEDGVAQFARDKRSEDEANRRLFSFRPILRLYSVAIHRQIDDKPRLRPGSVRLQQSQFCRGRRTVRIPCLLHRRAPLGVGVLVPTWRPAG